MATLITHPAIALGLTPLFKDVLKSKNILIAGVLLTILPDLDVVGLRLGIPYESLYGHRGFSHSILFAIIISWVVAYIIKKPKDTKFLSIWLYLFLSLISHTPLDALTNGGLGVAFFSPFSNERYFFLYRPIEVSPLSIDRFLGVRGLEVLKSELLWVWLPSALIFVFGYLYKLKTNRI